MREMFRRELVPPLTDSTRRVLDRRRLSTTDELLPATLRDLLASYELGKSGETIFAIADVSNRDAQLLSLDDPNCLKMCATALTFSHKYLFDRQQRDEQNPFDERFRQAGQIYNAALARLIQVAIEQDQFQIDNTIETEVDGKPFHFVISDSENVQIHGDDRFELADNYANELRWRHQTYGLGVPLLKIPSEHRADDERLSKYVDRIPQPVTAMAEITSWESDGGDEGAIYAADLTLHNPSDATDIQFAGQSVRMRSDVSAPIVHWKMKNKTAFNRLTGLLHPDDVVQDGLYMLEPFNPDKIPIIFIHGLASNPLTWIDAYNDLQTDPLINSRYQFWFYFYPTGQPFQESAADLRDDLRQLRLEIPDGEKSSLEETVLIGHSMGGLVARMVSVDSDDLFENAMFTQPMEAVADIQLVSALEPVYRFEHDRSVSRVITVATPHRGSGYSGPIVRGINRALNRFRPFSTTSKRVEMLAQLEAENPGWLKDQAASGNSVDTLARTSPILAALNDAEQPRARHNNIYGGGQNEFLHDMFYKLTGLKIQANLIRISGEDTDGVVGVRSSRFEDAESNFKVLAKHSEIQGDPQTIGELGRILRDGLNDFDVKVNEPDGTVVPVSASSDD